MEGTGNSFEKKRQWLFFLSKNRKKSFNKKENSKKIQINVKKCKCCEAKYTPAQWSKMQYVCKRCGSHISIPAYERLYMLLDHHSFLPLPEPSVVSDPLFFPEYLEKKDSLMKKTGLSDAVVSCTGSIGGIKCVIIVMDNRFLMGSMGSYVGEAITLGIEYANREKLPLIIFSASGGARMQEGIFSLLQMAKTSIAIEEFTLEGGLFVSCLTHPTTGGVTASFASLGDIMLAEPKALIGFAGPRVIEQTIRKKLPDGFQTAEYLEEHGFLDQVVERKNMRKVLFQLLQLHAERRENFASTGIRNQRKDS